VPKSLGLASCMAEGISISGDGGFEVDGCTYRIPEHFSSTKGLSYRTLLEPTFETPRGSKLTAEQRAVARTYLLRRAAACAIPGFRTGVPESLSPRELQSIHRWIAQHRPELSGECRSPRAKC
jgi:hypothetical protein